MKPKKNIILGATLPQSVHNDAQVQEIIGKFKKWLNIAMLPLLPLLIPPFLMDSFGVSMTWYMTWLLLIIVLPFTVFALHREQLIALKQERKWHSEASDRTFVDGKAATMPAQKIKNLWFLPPVAISLFPLVHELLTGANSEAVIIYLTFAIMTALFWPCYYLIFRLRTEVVNENMTLNLALTRVRRYNWGKFWLVATWATGTLNLLLWIFPDNSIAFLITILGYTLVLIAISISTEFATRRAQQKLTASDTGSTYLDEDDYWIWGIFYHNPNDSHFLVNDRIGMNMSVNLAKLGAKILMGFALVAILALPFFGMWMWIEEAAPTSLAMSKGNLVASHTGSKYVIPLNEVESIELVEELPQITKIYGTNFDNLNKGRFSVSGYGNAHLCIQQKNPPFLIITAGGESYILNDADSSKTREIYAQIG